MPTSFPASRDRYAGLTGPATKDAWRVPRPPAGRGSSLGVQPAGGDRPAAPPPPHGPRAGPGHPAPWAL